jgi:hypothetical protein
MRLHMADLVGLALIVGLILAGAFLVHSMSVTRSLIRVRVAALVSIVLMIAFMVHTTSGV